jgi:hypothetical protein
MELSGPLHGAGQHRGTDKLGDWVHPLTSLDAVE